MSVETVKAHVNLKDYFDKMTPDGAAAITAMCVEQLGVSGRHVVIKGW